MRTARTLSVALEVPTDDELADPLEDRVRYNLDNVLEVLDVAGRWDPDFVCFPEQMLHRRVSTDVRTDLAQPVPGPATDAVGERAAALDSYVLLPMTEAGDDGRFYNALVLIGPDGTVRGTYRKLRPTVGEMEYGLSPGTEATVWETEFGRVGAAICFDLMYPEIGVELARKRADVLFFASHLRGEERIRHWARDYGYHVVKSFPSAAEIARPTGDVVARNVGLWEGQEPLTELDAGGEARFAFAELNTDWKTFTRIPGNRRAVEEIQERHPDVIYHDSRGDETFALESRSAEVTVEELEEEYDMVTYRDYLDWTGRACLDEVPDSRLGLEEFPDVESRP